MPLGEMTGIRAGDLVGTTGDCLNVAVGPELLVEQSTALAIQSTT